MRNYKTIWSLQGDEWPETNCYLGTVFFMFSSLSADKSSYNYSLFRAWWSINRRENKAGRFTLLFFIVFHTQTGPGKSRGVCDVCLGPAQIKPGQATASRNSAEPELPWMLGDGVNNPSLRGKITSGGNYLTLLVLRTVMSTAKHLLSSPSSSPSQPAPVFISWGLSYEMLNERRIHWKWMNIIKTCA